MGMGMGLLIYGHVMFHLSIVSDEIKPLQILLQCRDVMVIRHPIAMR